MRDAPARHPSLVLSMRRQISLEVILSPPNDPLLRLTQALRELASLPETLVWSAVPDTDEARIWIVVAASDPDFNSLITGIKAIPGIRSISLHSPGQEKVSSIYRSAGPL